MRSLSCRKQKTNFEGKRIKVVKGNNNEVQLREQEKLSDRRCINKVDVIKRFPVSNRLAS